MSEQENFERIYGILQRLVVGVEDLSERMTALEAKDAITKPLWQEMRADQQRILDRMDRIEAHLQRQDERMDRIEAHLQQQGEKMEEGFRKLNSKQDVLNEERLDLRAEFRSLEKRVTRLEPIN